MGTVKRCGSCWSPAVMPPPPEPPPSTPSRRCCSPRPTHSASNGAASQTAAQVRACAALRASTRQPVAERTLRHSLRCLARHVGLLERELRANERQLHELVQALTPALLGEPGVGPMSAAQQLVSWSHAGRFRLRGCLRRPGWRRPTAGVFESRHPPSAEPLRGPPAQPRAARDRGLADGPPPSTDPGLPHPATCPAAVGRRDPPLPQALRRSSALPPHGGLRSHSTGHRRVNRDKTHRTVELVVTTFSTTSRPALRAAACGGRPRAGNDTTGTGEPASPSRQGSIDAQDGPETQAAPQRCFKRVARQSRPRRPT
jgi:hypothetical protein